MSSKVKVNHRLLHEVASLFPCGPIFHRGRDTQCGLMNSKSQPNATEDAMTSRLSDGEAHHTLNCLSEDTAGPVNEDASEHFPSNLAPEASADSFVDVSPAAAEDEAILLSEAADFSPMDSPEHVSQEVSPEGSFDLADYHPTSSSFTSASQCTEVVTDQVELDSAAAGQQLNQDALIANHHVWQGPPLWHRAHHCRSLHHCSGCCGHQKCAPTQHDLLQYRLISSPSPVQKCGLVFQSSCSLFWLHRHNNSLMLYQICPQKWQ
ncbi:hypothetical protein WJX82_000680 [Trebouxia sp. C0006]